MNMRRWVAVLCAMALLVAGLWLAVESNARRAAREEKQLLEDAIRRAVVTCYALEGRYPPTLQYLEDNYGIDVDARRYIVFYDSFADNVLPAVRVVALAEGGASR